MSRYTSQPSLQQLMILPHPGSPAEKLLRELDRTRPSKAPLLPTAANCQSRRCNVCSTSCVTVASRLEAVAKIIIIWRVKNPIDSWVYVNGSIGHQSPPYREILCRG